MIFNELIVLGQALFKEKYGITELGLYGSYARDEETERSDVDIFYERDSSFQLKSGLDFLAVHDQIAKDLSLFTRISGFYST